MKYIYNVRKHNAVFSGNLVMFKSKNEKYDAVVHCPHEYSQTFSCTGNLMFNARPPLRMFIYFLLWVWHISILRKDAFVSNGLIDIE